MDLAELLSDAEAKLKAAEPLVEQGGQLYRLRERPYGGVFAISDFLVPAYHSLKESALAGERDERLLRLLSESAVALTRAYLKENERLGNEGHLDSMLEVSEDGQLLPLYAEPTRGRLLDDTHEAQRRLIGFFLRVPRRMNDKVAKQMQEWLHSCKSPELAVRMGQYQDAVIWAHQQGSLLPMLDSLLQGEHPEGHTLALQLAQRAIPVAALDVKDFIVVGPRNFNGEYDALNAMELAASERVLAAQGVPLGPEAYQSAASSAKEDPLSQESLSTLHGLVYLHHLAADILERTPKVGAELRERIALRQREYGALERKWNDEVLLGASGARLLTPDMPGFRQGLEALRR